MVRLPLFAIFLCCAAIAQTLPYNYDEGKVGPYAIPDSLALVDGTRVTDAATWNRKRRPELLALFENQVYGKTPASSLRIRTGEVVEDKNALGGKAIRKQVTVYFTPLNDGPRMNVLVYLPSKAQVPVPVFLGLNFSGNHTVNADPGILMNDVWIRDPDDKSKMIRRVPDDRTRGTGAANWQVEKILAHGYGLATIYYFDIEPDFDGGMQFGVRSVLPDPQSWSAMGAWAWGLSRAVDYLIADRRVDPLRIAVMGHSRLGKAALWAAAQDTRFALVISNESGKGGASLLKRGYGETIDHLNTAFPHWFSATYHQYTGHPEKLPVDGNELLALIAPRPLYVASAEDDRGSDPKAEFLSAVDAGRVYGLFGRKGLGTDRMPHVNQSILHDIGYHVRTGKHDVTEYDWEQYLAFADLHWEAAK